MGSASLEDRFWSKVQMSTESDDCWPWIGSTTPRGYGKISVAGRLSYAHRVSFELHVRPIPSGLTIDHLCRNTSCVNPSHLEPVTQAVNNSRARALITSCPHGHPYDEENTGVDGGSRRCKACDRIKHAARASKRRGGVPAATLPGLRTHCPQGHAYDQVNTYRKPNGNRECRACHRQQEAARKARLKGETV